MGANSEGHYFHLQHNMLISFQGASQGKEEGCRGGRWRDFEIFKMNFCQSALKPLLEFLPHWNLAVGLGANACKYRYKHTQTNWKRNIQRLVNTHFIRICMRESCSLINSVSTAAHLHDPYLSLYICLWHHFTLTAGPAGFTSGQRTTHTLSIYQRHIRPLYQRVTNWPPPRRSSPHPKAGCQLWQTQVWPSSHILPCAPLCFMLNRAIFRDELLHSYSSGFCLNGPFWTDLSSFLFPIYLPLCSELAPTLLNHETKTKYKSSLLLLCHSYSPSTFSHLFSLFFLPNPQTPLCLSYSLFFALHLTQTHNSNKLWHW